jgi:hypothetical protein
MARCCHAGTGGAAVGADGVGTTLRRRLLLARASRLDAGLKVTLHAAMVAEE